MSTASKFVVPSISALPDISSVVPSISPATVNTPSASVIKSVSSVWPIVVPFIITLSTVKVVNVPKLVTFACAAVNNVPVKPSAEVIPPAEISAKSYPVPLVFTVVPGSACKPSKNVQGSPVALKSLNIPAYLCVPPTPYWP